MEAKLEAVIKHLMEGTKAKVLRWEPSERKNQFTTTLQGGAIGIDNFTLSDADDSHEVWDISFLDTSGDVIESFIADNQTDIELLKELHDLARRNALKVDEKLARLYSEIDSTVKDRSHHKAVIDNEIEDLKRTKADLEAKIKENREKLGTVTSADEATTLQLELDSLQGQLLGWERRQSALEKERTKYVF